MPRANFHSLCEDRTFSPSMPAFLRSRMLRRGGVFRDLTSLLDRDFFRDVEVLGILPDRIGHQFEGNGLRRTFIFNPQPAAPVQPVVVRPRVNTLTEAIESLGGDLARLVQATMNSVIDHDYDIEPWQVDTGDVPMPLDQQWFTEHGDILATAQLCADALWNSGTFMSFLRMHEESLTLARDILDARPELVIRVLEGLGDVRNLRVAHRYYVDEEGAPPRWPFTRPLTN